MNETKTKIKLGCLPTGCLVSIIMVIVVAIGLLLFVRSGIQSAYQEFAATAPIALPGTPSSVSSAAQDALNKLKTDCSGQTLSFTADEINYFIGNEPVLSKFKGLVSFEIKDSEVTGKFSVPLNILTELPAYSWLGLDVQGKYLNGQVVGSPVYDKNNFLLRFKSLQLNGHEAPEEGRMAAESWLLQSNFVAFQKISAIKIENGKLVIVCEK